MNPSIHRRQLLALVAVLPLSATLSAQGLLSAADANAGLKAALERGADIAVNLLGRPDGFLGNPKVRIPLPGALQDVADILRKVGQRERIEALETAMNRAAEQAVPESRALLNQAIKSMTVDDARRIITGGETSVTDFFAQRTREPLTGRFLPIVTRATERVELAQRYNDVAGRAARFGLVRPQDANLQQYVTGKALDGLYLMIAEEERKIRQDPVGTGSKLLERVFGSLR